MKKHFKILKESHKVKNKMKIGAKNINGPIFKGKNFKNGNG